MNIQVKQNEEKKHLKDVEIKFSYNRWVTFFLKLAILAVAIYYSIKLLGWLMAEAVIPATRCCYRAVVNSGSYLHYMIGPAGTIILIAGIIGVWYILKKKY